MFDSELVFMGFLTYNFNYLYSCVHTWMCNKYHRFNNKYMFDSELVVMMEVMIVTTRG